LNDKKPKENTNQKEILKIAAIAIILIIAIYIIYMIYGLIKQPTNVFVVENGKLTMEEETVRLYYS